MNIRFTYLSAFSGIGGLEKFNKAFIKALSSNFAQCDIYVSSLSDTLINKKYTDSPVCFQGFKGNKLAFLFCEVKALFKTDLLIVGHLNLAIIAYLFKLVNPKKKLIINTHGIDIWNNVSWIKKQAIKQADKIITVSLFSKKKIIQLYKIPEDKIAILHNTIDPFFQFPNTFNKNDNWLNYYQISPSDKVIVTIARLSYNEGYKGYDTIIQLIPEIIKDLPNIKYLIIGKYDELEVKRIKKIIPESLFNKHIILTGFVPDKDLVAHIQLGDIFAMPSKGEGFGIVFIEAMACGVPALAGNIDGSTDALLHGKIGVLVNPLSNIEIKQALVNILQNNVDLQQKAHLQQIIRHNFGWDKFIQKQKNILTPFIS